MAVTTSGTVAGLEVQDGRGIAQSDTQQVSSGKGKKQDQGSTISDGERKLSVQGGRLPPTWRLAGKEGSHYSLGIDPRDNDTQASKPRLGCRRSGCR